MRGVQNLFRWCCVVTLAMAAWPPSARSAPSAQLSIEDLKAKVASEPVGNRPRLCVEIAKRQLEAADKLYAADDTEKAQPALNDVVTFSEQARDYAIQSRKYQKQTEIAVRGMARKLTDLMRSLPHDEQAPLQDAIKRLQRVRDDLIAAMFPAGAK
jgi:hypothetical protein